MKIVILVPWRPAPHRNQLWAIVKHQLPNWPIHLGESPDGPFNRSAAINHAAAQTEFDVAIIHDADTLVAARQLEQAAYKAHETGRLVAAFTTVIELNRMSTRRYLAGTPNPVVGDMHIRTEEIVTQSSALAVTRTLWDKVGGFDEKFVGWAGEDNAFWKACTIHGGEPLRIDGPARHLWHRSAKPGWQDRNYQANQARWRRYAAAETEHDLQQIRAT